jgi:hypothetical protein
MSCVQSGYCCTVRPCDYGATAPHGRVCVYLEQPNGIGQRLCELYRVIKFMEHGKRYPMMGSGCSSTLFNDMRDTVIRSRAIIKQ